jgi:hypothetical protein
MRIAARIAKLLGGRGGEQDVRAEVDFHIDMRTASYMKDGTPPEQAAARARKRFGDVEDIMNDMHEARLGSATAMRIAVTTISVIAVAWWVYVAAFTGTPVVFPSLPDLPMKFVKRVPPPPPPPPTWEEFVAKVNTFGDGSDRKRRRP